MRRRKSDITMEVVRTPELLVLLLQLSSLVLGDAISEFTRYDFPSDFVFGSGTSAYQYEGATSEDGRTPGIWDAFGHEGLTTDGLTADVAADGYHRYKEDVKLMNDTGIEGYRFSISWSRLLPSGRGEVNLKGLSYYNNVIDELIKHGIQPHVTLYHFDFPQVLQDEYGGWLSPKIIRDFKEFADVCFREFGDRVSQWTTLNEPNDISLLSYDYGIMPPQRCSYPFGVDCRGGNSTTEPYIAAHNLILAHSAVVQLYKTKYQAIQKGKIGINVWSLWCYSMTNSTADVMAAQRTLAFMMGWFLNPVVYGDYPEVMKAIAGTRLPSFTATEAQQIKGSFDFIGINYYFPVYVADNSDALNTSLRDVTQDIHAKFTGSKGSPLVSWIYPPNPLPTIPRGVPSLLKYLKDTYGNPPIYIEENGYGVSGEDKMNDTERITYLSNFIGSMLEALRDGSDVRGYYMWSFVDMFEFLWGYTIRMGLYHVNFEKECERVPKLSAYWYSNFLKNGSVIKIKDDEVQ